MTDNPKSVRGPMHIDATPLMVTCDVERLVHDNVGELLDLLMGEFLDDFTEIVNGEADREYAFETLQARLVDRLSTKVALTGPQAMRVAGRMAELARPLAARSAHTAAVVMRTQQRKGAAA
ncbi:hypothetical protein [Streptomyces sp. bgisy154]|uniref:hypothetical protein n=1 Tax=Streptomyces sp. bgisy154 TaxID=3413794 RepID=UPI003D764D6F